jgi:hypothetical protein
MAELTAAMLSAIRSMKWPLSQASPPPLHMKTLEEMKEIRSKQLMVPPFWLAPDHPFVTDLPAALQQLFDRVKEQDDEDSRCAFELISIGLLLLGNGLADECHDIVAPMSWLQDTSYGGPSVYGQISEHVRCFASYVHSLVHRREGFHVGDFGMTGFENAHYWSGVVFKSPAADALPHAELIERVRLLIPQSQNSFIQKWAAEFESMVGNVPFFESRSVHQLCAEVLYDPAKDLALTVFAECIAELELRILLYHSLLHAGYQVYPATVVGLKET